MAENRITKSSHTNNFNFLRLVFASLVILSHSFELIDGNRNRELLTRAFNTISFGEFAVDGFFLLSGYLIVQSWSQTPNIYAFLLKRILRIYPGFIAASLICIFIVAPLGANPAGYFEQLDSRKWLPAILSLQTPNTPSTFPNNPYDGVNGAMWTIHWEFLCYLLVLTLGAIGLIRHRLGWLMITATIFVVILAQRLVFVRIGFTPTILGINLGLDGSFFRLAMFFFSGGSFFLCKKILKQPYWVDAIFSIALLLAMFRWASAEPALAILGGFLMFRFAAAPISLLKPFQTLPDISYGTYLYGWPVQQLLISQIQGITPIPLIFLSLFLSFILGLASWNLIEKPFMKLKPRRAADSSRSQTVADHSIG
ncbi:acyltransferase family protein [Roseateles koreensis]|uniref:Acyltransferase n=1 Tax=Roseateles koreensis TaxID=2987526 RepID=A0ABT5KR37_9BURK|nr:acyltransferase [Roseateles koreensis]MDC8785387.1 acyltransferase [Roseateles koreensis]